MEGDSRNPRASLLKKYDIPIDHLSFEYIESCKDKKELERIVRILRSGEEGIYPDLIKTAENQLRQIAPDSRVLRVESPALRKESISNEEWQKLEKDLMSWENEMKVMDKGLEFEKNRFDVIGNKNLPDVRKTIERKPENKGNKESHGVKIKVETNTKNERIKSGDYAAWEKFDVDKELLKIDLNDERIMEKNAKMKKEMEKKKKLNEEKKIEPVNVNRDSYTNVEQQILGNQAKDRGNECFKSGDYANALKYYNISLKFCSTANVYNNRAMTYIKLKNYEEALNDCNTVLKMEPNNVKALHRRATAYQNLSTDNYDKALADLLKIVSLEPTNRVAQSDLHQLKKKLNIEDVGKKFSMMIEESGNTGMISNSNYSEKSSYSYDNDNATAVHKLPLTYYGPSTSTFQCHPQSMTHRMLSGSSLTGQVMCKCNSNATRQNPLCHYCGERMSRPKQKPKTNRTDLETKKIEATPSEKIIQEVNQKISKTEIKESNIDCDKNESNDNKLAENIKLDEKVEINVLNESKKLDVIEVSNKESEGGKSESIDRNRKLFEELDLSLKERKNQSNEQFKIVADEIPPDIVNNEKKPIDITESLPKEFSQNEKVQKKSKKKKKESRQQNGNRMRYTEPVKIVQATKYLKPTSAEPKPENSNNETLVKTKEEEGQEESYGKPQFKSFVPRKNSEIAVLKSTGTNSRNSKERISSPGTTIRERKGKHFEGNKENIIDNHRNNNNNNNHFEDGDSSGVKSSFEFMKSWEAMRKTDESYEKRAEIIRVMRPEDLKKVIGNNLDSDMLTSLLECLEKHFLEKDPKKVTSILKELPGIPRFSLVNLFLSPNERKVIERLIETTEKKGFVLDEEVKSSLKLSI